MEDIYGDVGQSPEFRMAFAASLDLLWLKGTRRGPAGFSMNWHPHILMVMHREAGGRGS